MVSDTLEKDSEAVQIKRLHLSISNDFVSSKMYIYDKRDVFEFDTVNCLLLHGEVPRCPS